MSTITALIIAYNQAEKIRDCINSVLWADEIVLVDSHSTDGTAEIAASLGARVEQVQFEGFGHLRNAALTHCRGDWIFSLDSDERCTPEARDAIRRIVAANGDGHEYWLVPRRNYFLGRWIKHSGWYPNFRQPQLFRRGAISYSLDPVHESHIAHVPGSPGVLPADIWQVPFRNLSECIEKMNRYSTLGAGKLLVQGRRTSYLGGFARAQWAFFKHYVLKLGVLDGWAGFIIAFAYFEVTFYRYAKHRHVTTERGPPPVEPLRRNDPTNSTPPQT